MPHFGQRVGSSVVTSGSLKGDLIGRDDPRARKELDALVRLSAQVRAEVLAVTADKRRLSLRAELDAAAEVLASAARRGGRSASSATGAHHAAIPGTHQ
jgi:hypothetical protein